MIDPRDPCLKRRMLFAAAQCYDPAKSPREKVGWIGEPAVIARDFSANNVPISRFHFDQKIDLALVGRIAEGVLVAFRGTLPPLERVNGRLQPDNHGLAAILLDWLNDANCGPYPAGHYPGQVHNGFAGSLERLWGTGAADGLEAQIGRLLQQGPAALYFTGHSKGGPLANLAAWRARQKWPQVPVKVLTIAAARAGDDTFARAYGQSGIDCLRYEVDTDVVPLLPLGGDVSPFAAGVIRAVGIPYEGKHFGYQPVGHQVIGRQSLTERVTDFFGRLGASLFWHKAAEAFLPTVVDAHRIDPDSRYDLWVCEKGCPHGWR
ncbi:MAG: putative lipase [Alphaproteobacteria bacterium]|nr:putative lipase [Alphaproteobacteria bacterium]